MTTETDYEKLMRERKEQQDKIDALDKKLADIRKEKSASVLTEVKNKIAEFSFTVEDVFPNFKLTPSPTPTKVKTKSVKKEPKYKNAEGKTWMGGRGPKPKWIADILAAGGNIEDYRIPEDAPPHLVLND
jgi:DNA-binding protein H-NS